MDSSLLTLLNDQQQRANNLQERMEDAGCVLDFVVYELPENAKVTEAEHRFVLEKLFVQIQHNTRACWEETLACNPKLANQHFSFISYDITKALPKPWETSRVIDANSFKHGWRIYVTDPPHVFTNFERFFFMFDNPPYDTKPTPNLFADFCKHIGLLPDQDIEAFDWVGDYNAEPERSNWSNYFDEGKEWWGIMCLTIWNPLQRTLAAVAASATD